MPSISFPSLKSIVVAGVLAVAAHAANAASFTFDFTSGSTTQTVSGLTLQSIAGKTFDNTLAKTVTVPSGISVSTNGSNGLGVNYFGTDTKLNSPSASNPAKLREMLDFQFSQSVKLVSVVLNSVGFAGAGTPKLAVFLGDVWSNTTTDIVAADGSVALTGYTYQGNPVDFVSGLIGIGARVDSSFYISSITVESLSAVPLPAGGLLLGSLVLVPFLRRKRRAA